MAMKKKLKRAPLHNKDPEDIIHQLQGFIPAMCLYFVIIIIDSCLPNNVPLWLNAVAKVTPILILLRFVVLQSWSVSEVMACKFCQSVFFGLCFSLLGDLLLVYQDLSGFFFVTGLISFACGHVMYIQAFGWSPFGIRVFSFFSTIAIGFYLYLWRGGLSDQQQILQLGVAVYAAIIATMNWRAWARFSCQDIVDGTNGFLQQGFTLLFPPGRWYEFLGCVGAFFFLISDSCLSINKFVNPFPYAVYVIMITYYVGQLGIALSVVDGPDRYLGN